MFAQKLIDCDHISDRFGHFFVFQTHHAVMHPIACKSLAGDGFGLSDFVFVMRENKVVSATMNVDLFAEMSHIHRRAFNMPTRTTGTPRAIPGRLTRFCRLPKRKIHRMFFAFVHLNARTGVHGLKRASAQLAIIRIVFNIEVNIAIDFVGIPLRNQLFNHFNNLWHVFSGAWINRSRQNVEICQIALVAVNILLSQIEGVNL